MRRIPVLIAAMLIFGAGAAARDFHVSPRGDDAGPGTAARPFRTLARARDAVRTVTAGMTGDVVVYLHGGEYALEEAIDFGPADSGQNGHRVIYRAAAGETPVVTGGVPVTGWLLHDREKRIWSAPAAEGFRQLYIDGVPGIRARTPNREDEGTLGPWWKATVREKPDVLIASRYWEPCRGIARPEQVEMVMVSHWYHQRIRIGGHRPLGDSVSISPLNPEGKMSKELKFYADSWFFYENAKEFIDAPGEWYHDPESGTVYLCLAQGTDPKEVRVTVPRAATLVAIRGTAQNPVENLAFEGITFECTAWMSPSRLGLNVTQFVQPVNQKHDWDNPDYPAGMIRAEHTRRLAFRDNVIRNAGAHGIQFFADCDDADIEGNEIYNIAANGIEVDALGLSNPAPEQQSAGVAIWNNEIHRCGRDYTNGGGILAHNVRGLIVDHNHIHDMPYSGMQVGNQPSGMKPVGCEGNLIRYNHIHHCLLLHDDGGGIYTLGGIQKGTVIAENYVHDIVVGEYAGSYPIDLIYLDNFTSEVLVKDNVVKGGRAAERNRSKGNTLDNNVQENRVVESNAGIREGYDPRK